MRAGCSTCPGRAPPIRADLSEPSDALEALGRGQSDHVRWDRRTTLTRGGKLHGSRQRRDLRAARSAHEEDSPDARGARADRLRDRRGSDRTGLRPVGRSVDRDHDRHLLARIHPPRRVVRRHSRDREHGAPRSSSSMGSQLQRRRSRGRGAARALARHRRERDQRARGVCGWRRLPPQRQSVHRDILDAVELDPVSAQRARRSGARRRRQRRQRSGRSRQQGHDRGAPTRRDLAAHRRRPRRHRGDPPPLSRRPRPPSPRRRRHSPSRALRSRSTPREWPIRSR